MKNRQGMPSSQKISDQDWQLLRLLRQSQIKPSIGPVEVVRVHVGDLLLAGVRVHEL